MEVYLWRINNPNRNKSQCARELNISRTTVTKWWNYNIDLEFNSTLSESKIYRFKDKYIKPLLKDIPNGYLTVKNSDFKKKIKFKMNFEERKEYNKMFDKKEE